MPTPPRPDDAAVRGRQAPAAPGSQDTDTIAAIATGAGLAGVGIVRISGPHAHPVALAVAGADLPPGRPQLRTFRDAQGDVIDSGLVLAFNAPRSFTGEDVVELQGHGGPVVLRMLLDACLVAGARMARPGEFSERAFGNGKIDLTQAEAIADLISSASEAAVRGANRSLAGEFSAAVQALDARLVALRTYVEAAIDFSDEDIDLLADGQIHERLAGLAEELATLRARSAQGVMLHDGMTLALIGAPNVGKSSLLNRLAGEERAIVTEIPGTTRDLVRADLILDGLPVEVVDTAGLRATDDAVEQAGVALARNQAERADLVLWLESADGPEGTAEIDGLDLVPGRVLRVHNKVDLTALPPGLVESQAAEPPMVRISALTGAGVEALREEIKRSVGYQPGTAGFTARRRHLLALDEATAAVENARALAAGEIELLAEELRTGHRALGEIVGAMTSDELLGEIFSSFCIGK